MGVLVREKRGAWWLFINHHGRRKAKRVGDGPVGKKAAEAAAIQIRAKLATGNSEPLDSEPPVPLPIRFAEYAEGWLRDSIGPHRKERTAGYYRQVVETHVKPTFGRMTLVEIKTADVRAWIAAKLRGRSCQKHGQAKRDCDECAVPLARNTVKNSVATLRAILYQAQSDGLIANNP